MKKLTFVLFTIIILIVLKADITLEKAASKLSIDTEAFLVKYEEYVAKNELEDKQEN